MATCASSPATAREPAYSFRNPFHPEQCERAIGFADRQWARDPGNSRAQLVAAEGFLCKGLDDDPWALNAAIVLLRQIVAAEPQNFFARLELADALRKRFPLSDEAQVVLEQVRRLLESADVGAARPALAEYAAENAAAITAHHQRTRPFLQKFAGSERGSTLSPVEVAEFVSLLIMTGPEGLNRAGQSLDNYLRRHRDDTLATLYRAEILRGCASPSIVGALYAAAETRLCRPDSSPREAPECSLARWRLKQLQSVQPGPVPDPPLARAGLTRGRRSPCTAIE